MSAENDLLLSMVTMEKFGGHWHLHIYADRGGKVILVYESSGTSVDEALEQLSNWRKGVIIV